jgi:hypothetical protein
VTRIACWVLLTGAAVLTGGLVLTVPARGQSSLLLTPTEVTPITGVLGNPTLFTAPATCDNNGNLYLRMYQSGHVAKVTPAGKVEKLYRLDEVPDRDFKGARQALVISYAVDERGNVYVAAENSDQKTVLVKFQNDGDYEGVIPFDIANFSPLQVAAFAGGELLVSGYVMIVSKRDASPEVYTAIFDQYGHLVKDLTLSRDVSTKSSEDKARLPLQYKGAEAGPALEQAIATGTVGIGVDGDAYIFRNTKSPTVFVVSPAGELVRRMVLKSPAPDLWPASESMSGARAAVDLEHWPTPKKQWGATRSSTRCTTC